MLNTSESSDTASYVLQYYVRESSANTGKYFLKIKEKIVKELISWSNLWPNITSYIYFLLSYGIRNAQSCGLAVISPFLDNLV